MALVHADSPDEVVSTLQKAGYWDDHLVWRDLGDNENNYSILGAQQSDPIAALVEKLVNSVDARLMSECMMANIKPDSFVNKAKLKIVPFKEREDSGQKSKPKPPSDNSGNDDTSPAGIDLPKAIWVTKEEWKEHGFDEHSALRVLRSGNDDQKPSFDFFINKANVHLLNELKTGIGTEELIYEQFKVGILLLGMSVIHKLGPTADGDLINEKAGEFASSAALVLLPMIRHLGSLELLAKPKLKEAA